VDINSRQKITKELYECLKVQEILYFKMFSFKILIWIFYFLLNEEELLIFSGINGIFQGRRGC